MQAAESAGLQVAGQASSKGGRADGGGTGTTGTLAKGTAGGSAGGRRLSLPKAVGAAGTCTVPPRQGDRADRGASATSDPGEFNYTHYIKFRLVLMHMFCRASVINKNMP